MARPFSDLPKFINGLGTALGQAVNEVIPTTALHLHSDLVDSTPVDTGKARSNWRISFNVPDPWVLDPYYQGYKLGRGETRNAAPTKALAKAVIQNIRGNNGAVAKNFKIWIFNNVDYLGLLNNTDHSAQNSPGWVQRDLRNNVAKMVVRLGQRFKARIRSL